MMTACVGNHVERSTKKKNRLVTVSESCKFLVADLSNVVNHYFVSLLSPRSLTMFELDKCRITQVRQTRLAGTPVQ